MGRSDPRSTCVRRVAGIALLAAALLPGPPGAAEDDAAAPSGAVRDASPPSLDRLLRLPPSTTPVAPASRGGHSKPEWLERFADARAELAGAERRLAAAQDELSKLSASTSQWQVSAPGGAASENGPLSFELRQRIREGREDVERAQTALEELRIEANLAGVPESWTADPSRADAAEATAP